MNVILQPLLYRCGIQNVVRDLDQTGVDKLQVTCRPSVETLLEDTPAGKLFRCDPESLRKMTKDPEYIARKDEMIGEYEQVTDAAGEELFRQAITITPAHMIIAWSLNGRPSRYCSV